MRRSLVVLALVGLGVAAGPVGAVTPLDAVEASPDITVSLSGTVVDDEDAANDDGVSVVAIVNPDVPLETDLTAHGAAPGAAELYSFDTTVALPGPLTVSPGDVVMLTAGTYTKVFSAAAAGLPAGTAVDAVTILAGKQLLLSFDVSVAVGGGVVADDEDVVLWDPPALSLSLDTSTQGIDPALDLDGVHRLPSGNLLVSFDGSGTVDGVSFDDEDVLEFDLAAATFTMSYDGSAADAGWPAADLDTVRGLADVDGDGLADDEDNCPIISNPGQQDTGGIGTATPDGIGNVCQCGDITNNGIANGQDGTFMTRHALGYVDPLFMDGGKCDVTGNGQCNGQDGTFTTRAGLGYLDPLNLAPRGQNCHNADPTTPACATCAPCPNGTCS